MVRLLYISLIVVLLGSCQRKTITVALAERDAVQHTVAGLLEYAGDSTAVIPPDFIIDAEVVGVLGRSQRVQRLLLNDGTASVAIAAVIPLQLAEQISAGRRVYFSAAGLSFVGQGATAELQDQRDGKTAPISEVHLSQRMLLTPKLSPSFPASRSLATLSAGDLNTRVWLCGVAIETTLDASAPAGLSARLIDCDGRQLDVYLGGDTLAIPRFTDTVYCVTGIYTSAGLSVVELVGPDSEGCEVPPVVSLEELRKIYAKLYTDRYLYGGVTSVAALTDDLLTVEFTSTQGAASNINERFDAADGLQLSRLDTSARQSWKVYPADTSSAHWDLRQNAGNTFMEVRTVSSSGPSEAWLISPKLLLEDQLAMRLDVATQNFAHHGLRFAVSTNYRPGQNPSEATWESLDLVGLPTSATASDTWQSVGPVALPASVGAGYLAIRYQGDAYVGDTSIFRVDNIMISRE